MWARLWANPLLFWLLVLIVIFVICWLIGIHFHFDAGQGGVHLGVEHGGH